MKGVLTGVITGFMLAGHWGAGPAWGQEVPHVDGLVSVKRAPVVITVGGAGADIPGYTSRAIQLAVDALTARGGGTVRLNAGEFQVAGTIRLASHVTLEGAGPSTVLRKANGFRTHFVVDADWGMMKATVADASGFQLGAMIELFDDAHNDGWDVTTAVLTAIEGNVIYFDTPTVHDYIAAKNGTISNGCSIVAGVGVENIRIANFTVEGNKETNDTINGCRGGGIYLHRSRNCVVEGVHVNGFNGDSFSWQTVQDITVRGCEASNGNGLGFHPGTGAHHSIVENNVSHHNTQDGIFLCWRAQYSVFRNNVSYANGRHGISIGHQDTDNLFEGNRVYENGSHGVCFREETEQNSGHRNTFRKNIIENNGTAGRACGVYIGGRTRDIVLENNTIRSTGKGAQQAAIGVGPEAAAPTARNNVVEGHPETVQQ